MRCAVLSDIHGNLEALEAVLADVAALRPDRIVCLGDFVGYGASPNECIARLRPLVAEAVAGNHDLAACGRLRLGYFNDAAAEAARWTDVSLTPEHRAYLHAQSEKMENDEKFRKEAMEGMDEVVSKSLGLKPNAFRLAYI
mgnify:CR=1 FL=1